VHTTMIELMDIGSLLPITRYGDQWRRGRRIFHQEFNSTTPHKYKETQTKYARALTCLLRDDPDGFEQHVRFLASGIILEAIYGFNIKPINDPYVRVAKEGVKIVEGIVAGTFLVDAFPFLRYLPEWIPGSMYIGTKAAKIWRKGTADCCRLPFQETSRLFDEGTATPCFTTSWLSRISNMSQGEEKERVMVDIRQAAGTAFLGAYETSSSSILNFILSMVENPEVQCKAQAELDRVVGRDRLPDFSDKENLPYIFALYKEVLRWAPILPLSVPHGAIAEDEYKGMRIPAGSIVFPNAWAMSRNESEYGSDVEAFRPERFLNTNVMDPTKYVFGFGRRICPGRYMGENSIFIALCYILQLFEIGKAINEDGTEVPPNPHWVSGITVHLAPFQCSIKPRFEGAEKLINSCRTV